MTTRALESRARAALLDRILETPDLPRVIQALEPATLHRLVRACGLEDAGPIVALATTEQLLRVFDHDLWRSENAGDEETFDADRFGLWLEVLAEAGASTAARRLAEMDFDLVTAGVSRCALVVDTEAVLCEHADERDPMEDPLPSVLDGCVTREVAGYTVVARCGGSTWDTLVDVLASLESEHAAVFARLLRRCCEISTEYVVDNGGLYEVLTSDEQVVADVFASREQRREAAGYVSPVDAAGFLRRARQADEAASSSLDAATAAWLRESARGRESAGLGMERLEAGPPSVQRLVAALRDAGVVAARQPPLLGGGSADAPGRALVRERLAFVESRDSAAYGRRTDELRYLANVLVAGCPLQSRRFRTVEAADAALSTCNLGLENWTAPPPVDLLVSQDLVTVFRRGWRIVHERACLPAARGLVDALGHVTSDDADLRRQLATLRRRLSEETEAGTPWRARDDIDVLATFDQPTWFTLLCLVDECPVVPQARHAASGRLLRVSTAFDFVSENRQLGWIDGFVATLAERLAG